MANCNMNKSCRYIWFDTMLIDFTEKGLNKSKLMEKRAPSLTAGNSRIQFVSMLSKAFVLSA